MIDSVHQLLPNFNKHDAIGNEAVIMRNLLREMGYHSEIYAELGNAPRIESFLNSQNGRTAALYHFSIASSIPSVVAPLQMPKLVRYHNITPHWFFTGEKEQAAKLACRLGRRQIPMVGIVADAVAADSHYNAEEMSCYTGREPTVIPILRDYERLVGDEDRGFAAPLKLSGKKALLFIGRIAPNKCQHDLIQLMYLAKRFVSADLQLILVGSFFSEEFAAQVHQLCSRLGLSVGSNISTDYEADVLIPKHVSDAQIAALYRHASAFVSMSEHEGFGVPLVEAMHFDLPVLAHSAAAVPETIGEGGILVNKADWPRTLAALKGLLFDPTLRRDVIAAAQKRRSELSLATGTRLFRQWILESLPQT